MKRHLLFSAFILFSFNSLMSQINCDGGRYHDSIFADTVIQNVLYGENLNYDGTTRQLSMDIYMPKNDTASMRPLIIFAPKGSFLSEDKAELTMTQLCHHFAQLGYVAAAIDYRVGMDYMTAFQYPEREYNYALLRAIHDYRAAIRFFRQDAATTNTYKIDPDLIIAGGSSAGAMTALHVAYMDKLSELPTSVIDTTGLGGIEGTTGNPGYPSTVNYVVNLCGAINDSAWIEAGDIPVVSMHGNLDTEVPYGTATITMLVAIAEVDGSASINLRAEHVGVDNPFYTFWGVTHIPYDENAGGSFALYMDTVLTYTTDVLHNWICGGNLGINDSNISQNAVNVYPNPATDLLTISSTSEMNNATLILTDATGRVIFKNKNLSGKEFNISIKYLSRGIYFYSLQTPDSNPASGKLLIQ